MTPRMQGALPVLGGVALASVVMMLAEGLGVALFPLPVGVDLNDPVVLAAAVAGMPFVAKALVVFGWLAGTTVGAAFAAWRTPRGPLRSAVLVGVAMQAAGIANLMSFAHPTWMIAAAALVFVPPAWAVGSWFERRGGQV